MPFNIMDRKEYFLDQKGEASKTSEKSSFSKRLVRVFIKKSSLLPCWFFRQTKAKRSFSNILDRKEYFLEQKSEVSKTS